MPRGYKTFFMLNSAEHECSAKFSKEEFTIFSYLRFISRKNFMLGWLKHEKRFITSGQGTATKQNTSFQGTGIQMEHKI